MLLLEASADERATLEAAFALIDSDSAPRLGVGGSSDAAGSSDPSTWQLLGTEEQPRTFGSDGTGAAERAAAAADTDAADTDATAAAPAAQTARVQTRRKRAGDRKKEELVRLRADAQVLQARADFLARRRSAPRLSRADKAASDPATSTMGVRVAERASCAQSEPPPQPDSRLAVVWKSTAERQRQRRAASEVESVRLRALVKAQQRTIQNLRSILQRQAELQREPSRGRCSPAEMDKLREMWEELDHYYLATDLAFQLNGLVAAGYAPAVSAKATPLSPTATLVEVSGGGLVPLGYREAAATLWAFIANNCVPYHAEQRQVDLERCGIPNDDASVACTYSLDQRVGGTHVALYGSHASRRYLEQDRAVTVYSSVARPVEIRGARVAGVRVVDHGRIVVSDVPGGAGPLCLCQASNEIVIEVDSAHGSERTHLSALANAFMAMKSGIYHRLRDGFEDAALEQRAPTPRLE